MIVTYARIAACVQMFQLCEALSQLPEDAELRAAIISGPCDNEHWPTLQEHYFELFGDPLAAPEFNGLPEHIQIDWTVAHETWQRKRERRASAEHAGSQSAVIAKDSTC